MEAAKCRILGSDYVGVFATATDKLVITGRNLPQKTKHTLTSLLKVNCIEMTIVGYDLVGLFCRANSNGILFSNIILEEEFEQIKRMNLGLNVEILKSNLNALGSNILTNDKIAIINPDYSDEEAKQIEEVLGVEVLKSKIDGFKTVGANNILTNTGLAINNKSTDEEKEQWDKLCKFNSIRTTANTGGLAIGLAAIANSNAVIVGEGTTGYELARIVEALE
jgi:translation initiation factor 6